MKMNDHSTGDKLALQKRGEQTNAGAAEYSDTIRTGLAWAKGALPAGTYNDLAMQVYATIRSNDPNRYEQAARALSEMMDESARQQKAFHDATEGSKVVLGGDPKKAAEYVRQLRAANAAKAQAEAEKKAKAEAIAKANADAKAAGGTQGVQGAQAGVKTGNAVVGGGVQGSNNKPGKKPRMSDAEINAFLNEELGGDTTGNGTYASADVPKGGTKTIGYEYDPNPGNVSLAYAMRNAPEQERRTALIDKWNQEHGRSGSTGYATGEGMLTSGSNGTYATGEGIKDANGNVLTNPGGDWEYQYALRDPQYGLGMMDKMSDAQKNYLQAVADAMGYKYNFTGANRFV